MRRLMVICALLAAQPAFAQTRGAGGTAEPLTGCATDLHHISQMSGWQTQWMQALGAIAARPEADWEAEAGAWKDASAGIRADIEALRGGLARAETAPRPVADRVLAQVRTLQAQFSSTPLLRNASWKALIEQDIGPAVEAYAVFLETEYLPRTRDGGLASLAEGARCFAGAVQWWTSLKPEPDEMEAAGRRLLDEARAEMAKAAGIGVADLPKLLAELRAPQAGSDKAELLAVTQAAFEKAEREAPRWFKVGTLPPIKIEPLPEDRQEGQPAGIYRAATDAGPAAYVINPSRPEERRLMAEVIAFHEMLPGHHLGFSLSKGPGRFNSGFIEGWGIYAEYLAAEMGLYSTPRDLLGMHAKHLWAAGRLIVEPGLHVRGWTRDQAIAFMRENTTLSTAEIEVEVDRYLAMPGQSLSYMLGYDHLRAARKRAEEKLGHRFDIKAFHDVVLAKGSRPLSEVDADVDAWIAKELQAS